MNDYSVLWSYIETLLDIHLLFNHIYALPAL